MVPPTVLTIAGFDPYGGAGIQADIKTIHALGGYALSATTALTAQNGQGVHALEAVSASMLDRQLRALLDEIAVDAVKIGMLANTELIDVAAEVIEHYALHNVVLDPVLVSSSGRPLLEAGAVERMVERLFPLCRIITPNLDETNRILNTAFDGTEIDAMAAGWQRQGVASVLLKGGHTVEAEACDTLIDGTARHRYCAPRIITPHTHGTGCILSSAIATHLASGATLPRSVREAKTFLTHTIRHATGLELPYRHTATPRKEPLL